MTRHRIGYFNGIAPFCFILFLFDISSSIAMAEVNDTVTTTVPLNPFSFILLELGLIVIVALVAQILSNRYRFPVVIGELVTGISVGNLLYWLNWSPLFSLLMHLGDSGELFKRVWGSDTSISEALKLVSGDTSMGLANSTTELMQSLSGSDTPEFVVMVIALWIFSNFGVYVLLFKMGLETHLEDLINAEPVAYLVSAAGAAFPFLLGFAVGILLLPQSSFGVHVFLAATLCTTSAAISDQLLSTVKNNRRECRLIRDAAYIDDLLGIFLLAILMGVALHKSASMPEFISLSFIALIFMVAIILFGRHCASRLAELYPFDHEHIRLIIPLSLMFILSWFAEILELGVIAGAFGAGLILNKNKNSKLNIETLISPIESFFVPIFFVFVGMQVNLKLFLEPRVFALTIFLTLAAVAGKLMGAMLVRGKMNHSLIAIGMIPRGEAVLIFISVGKVIGLISDSIFTIVVMMVILTNVIASQGLRWVQR